MDSKSNEPIKVGARKRYVRIIVVDIREEKKQFELGGYMEIPVTVISGNIITSWAFDEVTEKFKGQVCDPHGSGVNIVFPITANSEVISTKTKQPLSFDEICGLFKQYHPTLDVLRKK